METDGGGWTVFQRRQDGSVDFFRNWADYDTGFGSTAGEFWLGLSKVHRLTEAGVSNTLRFDLEDAQGNTAYAEYSTFNIGDNSTEYTLTVAGYSGTAGDSLSRHDHNGQKFSTKDNQNDIEKYCVGAHQGAWWYNHCTATNLNGIYGVDGYEAIVWWDFTGAQVHRDEVTS